MQRFLILTFSFLCLVGFSEEPPSLEEPDEVREEAAPPPPLEEMKRWYFEVKPGYSYFMDKEMRTFFNNGGVSFRGEMGYRFWSPLMVFVDASYFQKKGKALGGTQELSLKIASITLGLKAIYFAKERFALYTGAGPRLFMMLLKNGSAFVCPEDNKVDFGWGFDAGAWIFPFKKSKNLFFDIFADYSWKNMGIDEDPNSSLSFDVDISHLTAGIGIGGRF